MFYYLFIRGLKSKTFVLDSKIQQLGIPCFKTLLVIKIKSFTSKASSPQTNEQSFKVSYLLNACGLSLTSAKSASKRVNFEGPQKPDSVLNFLRNHGFTNTHISKLIRTKPTLLLCNPEKTFLPKLEFLGSIGLSNAQIARICTLNPNILSRSLHNCLIPMCELLKSVIFPDEKVTMALNNHPRTFTENPRYLIPNLAILKKLGMPQSSISILVCNFLPVSLCKPSKFEEIVKEVNAMGFDPLKVNFVQAIHVFFALTKAKWESKFDIYGRWGWSRDETLSAFKRNPFCMIVSEVKIMRVMDFLVNKMGWHPGAVARSAFVLGYSLEKRIVPRCSVIRVLLLKGLVKGEIPLSSVVVSNEKAFLKMFVIRYQEAVPQLLCIFQRKVSIQELGFGFEERSRETNS